MTTVSTIKGRLQAQSPEAQRAQRFPVLDRHARRRGAQLLGDRAQRPVARPKALQLAPPPLLDRRDQFGISPPFLRPKIKDLNEAATTHGC